MQLDLSEEQTLLLTSLEQLFRRYHAVPADQPLYCFYSAELQQELAESGFLTVGGAEEYGPLGAALVAEAVARLPWAVEAAASALVGPALRETLDGPLALCEGIGRPTRYLAEARHAVTREGDRLVLADLEPGEVESVPSVLAYPVGILRQAPRRSETLDPATARSVRRLWRVALAAEAAGLMRAALDQTVAQVKDRRQFGHPLGDFQALQHRLAIGEQIVSASYLLSMRAAQSATEEDAALAALYVQENMRKVIYDCHQFSGAMGLTLEYPLHLWTYRLKFIQGEFGGRAAQAELLAECAF